MGEAARFAGKTTVVTGGAKGIGQAIAARLAAEGATVWTWDLVPPTVEVGPFFRVDVTDSGAIAAAAAEAARATGRIDVLVNNAGFTGPSHPVEQTTLETWQAVIAVNLTATFDVCRHVLPHMRRAPAGRIVNIASLAGKEGTPRLAAYSAAKAGVIAFTKSLAKELADTPIRVNALAPAAVATDILQQMAPEVVRGMIDKSPLKRLGTVDEVAEITAWLCSEACSFNTGACFDLSGGRATY